jgi:hypothetical protein
MIIATNQHDYDKMTCFNYLRRSSLYWTCHDYIGVISSSSDLTTKTTTMLISVDILNCSRLVIGRSQNYVLNDNATYGDLRKTIYYDVMMFGNGDEQIKVTLVHRGVKCKNSKRIKESDHIRPCHLLIAIIDNVQKRQ